MACPLCRSNHTAPFHRDTSRLYFSCNLCNMVFLDPSQHLSHADERAEYLKHENHPDDIGYRRFLSRLSVPLCERLPPRSSGLDFGCGPGPTLSVMLEEQGHSLTLYDPFFVPNTTAMEHTYDFITASEVVEHLHAPGEVLRQLYQRLNPGGWLGLMTKRVRDRESFATWHYKNDPTHVCFFHLTTFEWLTESLGAKLEVIGDDVVLLQKPVGSNHTGSESGAH